MVYEQVVKLLSKRGNENISEQEKKAIELLEQHPGVAQTVDPIGRTLLFWASQYNKKAVVHYLLKQRVDLDRMVSSVDKDDRYINGKTPIHIAYDKGHYDVVKALLDAGAKDIAFPGGRFLRYSEGKAIYQENDCYLIHRAARDGQLWLMKHLLDRYPYLLEQRNGKGETPLLVAVKHAFVTGVRYLVSQGASVDVATKEGVVFQKTALHWACQPGWYQVAEVLIRGGARDTLFNGEYVFHRLILDNQLKLVQALYERQPELLYVRDRYTKLPVALANENNCFQIAAFLHAKMGKNDNTFDITPAPSVSQEDLKISADNVNARDAGGMTPLMRAVCAGDVGKVSTLLATHAIALDKQPDTDKHGQTALQLAYEKQCITIVGMLLDAGAKVCPELRTTDFWWLAANMAEIKTVERLLDTYTVRGYERCLNSLIQREVFKTAENRMCIAAKHGYNHVLQYLIAQQESVNTPLDAPGKTSHGKKPLDFALEAGHNRAVRILEAAGATPSPEKQPCLTALSMFTTCNESGCNESGLDVSDEAMAESVFGQGSYTAQRMTGQ